MNLIGSDDLGESEDEHSPQGDGFLEDGPTLLVPSEYLAPGGHEILRTIEPTTPAERQSLLQQDPKFYYRQLIRSSEYDKLELKHQNLFTSL